MWLHIKAAVAIVSGIGLIFYIPIQTRRIAGGWVPANFTGNAADYPAFWAKRAIGFICLSVGVGAVLVVLALMEDGLVDALLDAAVGVIWFVIAAITYLSRQQVSRLGP